MVGEARTLQDYLVIKAKKDEIVKEVTICRILAVAMFYIFVCLSVTLLLSLC